MVVKDYAYQISNHPLMEPNGGILLVFLIALIGLFVMYGIDKIIHRFK